MTRTVDGDAFAGLFDETARDVLRYAARRGCPDPEDLVAEVYAVAWRRRAELPSPLLRRAWLFGVARRLLLADARRRRRDEETSAELSLRDRSPAVASPDRTEVVAAAMARLSPGDREVLRLVSWEGLTPAELAVALGVRPGTARVRLHRARRAFASDAAVRTLVGSGTDEPEAPDSAQTSTVCRSGSR